MAIDLRALKTITNRLFDHIIETRGISTLELDRAFYWDVRSESRYDVSQQPTNLDMGSLADDWDFLSVLLNEEEDPIAYQLY